MKLSVSRKINIFSRRNKVKIIFSKQNVWKYVNKLWKYDSSFLQFNVIYVNGVYFLPFFNLLHIFESQFI